MFKVFLADDEIVVREGIRSNFPWDETEFVLAGEAPDGEIALSMLQDIKPDILITDIKMPFMDGLSLCRQVTRTMPWIYVVILSGYDDFAYAREAISLGVKEYLLKPVSGQELLAVLLRIAGRIREEKRQQTNLRVFREQLASSGCFLRGKILSDLFAGCHDEMLLDSARALQINLLANCYLVMLVKPAQKPETRDQWLAAQRVLDRLTDGSGGSSYLCEAFGGFALLVLGDHSSDLEERAYGLAQSAQYDVERSTGLKLRVAIGAEVRALEDVVKSAEDARQLMDRMEATQAGDDSRSILSRGDAVMDASFTLLDLDAVPIAEQLKHATLKDVDAMIQHYFKGPGDSAQKSLMMANYFFVDVMLAASRLIKENHGVPQDVMPAAFRVQNSGASMLSVDEVLPLCRDILERAIVFRDAQGSARYGAVIRKAKAFITEHYADSNITLSDVARDVALSNNHFCTVFSQEMGVTFTEYLTAIRIAKAKELLSATAMRTSDVAYEVGYNDPHYFSYLFKKNTGLSPRDYRKDEKVGS